MKQHQRWLNETLNDKTANKFEAETQGCKSMGDVVQVISEVSWRAALGWYYKTAEHISPSDYEILEKELEDETSQDRV